MDDEDKLHARRLREREKHRNESPEQRATRLQVSHWHGLSVHACNLIVQSQLLYLQSLLLPMHAVCYTCI